jgi:type I restriction enzyme S subunit
MRDQRELAELVQCINEKITAKKDPNKPYVGLEHIPQRGSEITEHANAGDSISTNSVFQGSDVLFGKLRPNLRKCVLANFDGYCSTDILVLRALPGTSSSYAVRILQSEQVGAEAEKSSFGTKMPRTSWASLKNIKIFAPPVSEQQQIAQILDTLDTQLQKTEALIAKLEKIKEGLLHDLLTRGIDQNGQLRPPPEQAPELYKKSALGLIPKEWEATTVGELGVWRGGATPSKGNQKFWPSQGLLWVSPKDLNQDIIDITEDKVSELACGVANLTIFPPETVLVVFRSGILRRKLPVVKVLKMFTVNQDIKALLPSDEISKGFIHYLLQGHTKGILNSSLKAGTTVESLDFRFFSSYRLPLPPLDEQEKISARLGSIEKRLAQEIKFLEKQKINKIGLMDDLLTGHVRVTPLLKDAV